MRKSMSTAADTYLEELQARDFRFQLDSNNKLALQRKLPQDLAPAPAELIPEPVLKLHEAHTEGKLSKETAGVVKYHDRVKLLRRYHLLAPPKRLSPIEKRQKSRDYLRQWRKSQS
jgi:hypothetical protein